jgi:competence ComEA-like helix-hairpin-helix protein
MQNLTKLRVKINSASPEELAKLHGIGEHRAKLIVAFRNAHGLFVSPDDLAKVKGINQNLAILLAPHIDWEQPIEPEEPNKKDWMGAFYWSIISLVLAANRQHIPDQKKFRSTDR